MNIDNANKLIARLETCSLVHPDDVYRDGWSHVEDLGVMLVHDRTDFNMYNTTFGCGSPACIAGHAADLMGEDPKGASGELLAKFLEIEDWRADDLFMGRFLPSRVRQNPLLDITPEAAIEGLRAEIAWSKELEDCSNAS